MYSFVLQPIKSLTKIAGLLILLLTFSANVWSAQNPFSGGWVLDTNASSLTFQTIKNGSKLETSGFASYQGSVDETGAASLVIQLDSVDTKVDLRNVRMRFLLFQTFKFPEAKVSATIDPNSIADLSQLGQMSVPLTFELDLHGVKKSLQVQTTVTALTNNRVSVASVAPISIPTDMFDLTEGVKKLEEAATVTIVPMGSVSFNLVFNTAAGQPVVKTAQAPASSALETVGNFSQDECIGRLEILSRTGAIYFKSGSAELDPESQALLSTTVDIVQRCPSVSLAIEGHTDAAGSEVFNQYLSEQRASSVLRFLIDQGVESERLVSVGYGETRPIASNDTARNRSLNRRIEFVVTDG